MVLLDLRLDPAGFPLGAGFKRFGVTLVAIWDFFLVAVALRPYSSSLASSSSSSSLKSLGESSSSLSSFESQPLRAFLKVFFFGELGFLLETAFLLVVGLPAGFATLHFFGALTGALVLAGSFFLSEVSTSSTSLLLSPPSLSPKSSPSSSFSGTEASLSSSARRLPPL